MQTSDPDIYAAGDAVEVVEFVSGQSVCIPMAGPANRQGRIVADNIFGRDSRYRGTQGSALMKVFDMTMGVTGPNEKFLKRAGVPYRRIYLNPNGHAGYYPGTSAMHFKLLFSPDGMKILGAQIVGVDGVDKRIDVIATAMRGNLSVFDLEHLELGYAPPYGSAKDPVNMAGFIASNLLRGDLELWYGDEFMEKSPDAVILDVRTHAEFEAWHIPQAVNLPVQELRKRIGELDKSRAYDVYCKVGFRSYLAYRILKQNGFRARTLAGGTEIFRAFHPAPARPTPPAKKSTCGCSASPGEASDKMVVKLDCSGMQCPGPIRRVSESLVGIAEGAVLEVTTTDQGFAKDISAWCAIKGHELLSIKSQGGGVVCCIRKGSQVPAVPPGAGEGRMKRKTMVVFSGELDKVLAAFVIANGAVTMGDQVTMFFTFWGLNALRKPGPQAPGKGLIDRMFGWMMPKGTGALKLSNMHMMGMGTALMRHVMKAKNVESLEFMMGQARLSGVKIVACSMSMDVMGLKQEELVDGVEIGGVATFLAESEGAGMTLFI
jgi:peroxiredoxin family protein/rhodanese-related sulfurtransferase/TusA-related sulfurtransferase